MTTKPSDPLDKQIHPDAAAFAKRHVFDYAELLITHAKVLAHEKEDDIVLTNHIKEAIEIIRREPKRKPWKEVIIFVSSTMFGIAVPSFLAELDKLATNPTNGSPSLVIIYAAAAMIFLAGAIWALLSSSK